MTKNGPVTLNGGSNLTAKLKKIQDAISNVRTEKEQRAEISANITAIREGMAAIGIPKAAFDMALRYLDWEPEKRQGFDVAYALVREAGGLPLQGDLFMAATALAADVVEKKKAAEPSAKDIADRMFDQTTRKTVGDKGAVGSVGAVGTAGEELPAKKASNVTKLPTKDPAVAQEEEPPAAPSIIGGVASAFKAAVEEIADAGK